MCTNIKFGECLRSLLSILDVSIVKLSKAINTDSSNVSRWVNEKRTPSYKTTYIEEISEYLSSNVINSFQKEHINKLFIKICGADKIEISTKEKIKKVLLQSQGYSIEYKKKLVKEKKTHSIYNEEVLKFMDNYKLYSKQDPSVKNNSVNSINLSKEDKIIIGYKNVLLSIISLLEFASEHKGNDRVIYISFSSDLYLNSHYNIELINFRNAILKAIDNGWNILFLLRLSNNINGILKFIDFAQPLIDTCKFQPYYYKKYSTPQTDKEFVMVPEIGALLGLPNSNDTMLNTAFYFKNKVAVDILKYYFKTKISTQVQPLVKFYALNKALEYCDYLAGQEDSIGNRIMYKDDFSILILPKNLYIKLLQRENLSKDEINISLEFYEKRLKSFLWNIKNYKYTDIYPTECVNNLIKYRKLRLYFYNKIETINLEVHDVIELLKNIITLLKKYNNYNIAFIPKNLNNTNSNSIFYCMVKERKTVMLESYEYSGSAPRFRISSEEPLLIKALEVYFNEILEQVAPINKNKNEIINWIQYQINLLINAL